MLFDLLESWFTNFDKTLLNRSQHFTGTVQTTYWRNQAKLTTRERLNNLQYCPFIF